MSGASGIEHEKVKGEFSGGSVDYYKLFIAEPANLPDPYTCECEDIIEALGMTFSEACVFKGVWRSCAARTLGKYKDGMDVDGVYDAEKMEYYSRRTVVQRKRKRAARRAAVLARQAEHAGEDLQAVAMHTATNRSVSDGKPSLRGWWKAWLARLQRLAVKL